MKIARLSRLLLTSLLAGSVFAAHGAVDDDFMRVVEDTFKEADAAIGVKDAKTARTDAKELEKMFQEVVEHYARKGDAEEGVKLSRKSIELSAAIGSRVAANDFDGAAMASAELGRTCKSCHNVYKE
ncbi:hypothetical protein [Zoogloea sp.]|uniref:hypothetical protein n=1 Tax=Zoogloea sp. TaxID=49181 RepID=UPI0035B49534